MGSMIQLQLFITAVILVSIGQVYLMARYLLWPHIHRLTHCPWCWEECGMGSDYPAPWSSTICHYHDRQMRAQSAARRLTRHLSATAPTKPVAAFLQAEEVQA